MDGPLNRAVLLGLGLLDLTKEKAKTLADELVKRGEVAKEERAEFLKRLVKRGEETREELGKLVEDKMGKVLSKLNIATKSDLNELKKAIDKLARKIAK